MTKKEDLAKKKKKREVKEIKEKSKFRIVIDVDDEENISVDGPIGNFNLFMKIMSGAINVANEYSMTLINQVAAEVEKEKAGKDLVIQ